jgi:small subunit ribosomal protein S13
MIYLFESKISETKSVFFALTYVYGINKTNSLFICKKLGFSKNFKIKDLSKDQINKLIKIIEFSNINLASDLKKTNLLIFKKLLSIKSYRGLRRNQGLPIRGQRTHTNAKTSSKIK